jgi:HD-GYP domain-containing protein (c-di-GMP phosphodiesterase class II)
MSEVTAAPIVASPNDDDLVELQRSVESTHLQRIGTTGLLAAGLITVAVGALALPSHRPASAVAIVSSILAYAIASRVEIEFPSFAVLPTQAVFVVMWFVDPVRSLPLMVCAAMVLGRLPEIARRRMPADRLLLTVATCWYAAGPMLVLYVAGPREPRWADIPIYLGALGAQFPLDFLSNYLLARAVVKRSALDHLRNSAPAYAFDAFLAPLGFLAAFPASRHPAAVLLLLPVLVVAWRASVDREQRNTTLIELNTAYQDTSYLVGELIEADDEYTGAHSRELVGLVLGVADVLRLGKHDRQLAELTAILHDVGKVRIPKEIIRKPEPLTDEERELINTHTILGEQLLEKRRGLLGEVGPIVRSCHERWDGAGYPDGLAGEGIPLVARIVCACDAWSAMTTDRPYRTARPLDEAAAEMRGCSGTPFDPIVVDALVRVLNL